MIVRLRALVAGLIPPLLLRLVLRRKPDFTGVFERFADVPDDDPWNGEYWLRISRQKLEQVRDYPRRTVPPGVHACHAIVAQAANRAAADGGCRVLDFGGGTGFVYYAIRDVLSEGVSWHVVDAPHLAVMAREVMGEDARISFSEAIPDGRFDLLYVNTTLQYIEDPRSLLGALLKAQPQTVVLTRLMAGDVPDWITMQTIGGRRSPCQFLDLRGLIAWFAEQGYTQELRSVEDPYDGAFAKDVPERLRIPYDVNVVLRRAAS